MLGAGVSGVFFPGVEVDFLRFSLDFEPLVSGPRPSTAKPGKAGSTKKVDLPPFNFKNYYFSLFCRKSSFEYSIDYAKRNILFVAFKRKKMQVQRYLDI